MKKPIWAAVITAMVTAVLGAAPVHAAAPPSTSTAVESTGEAIDPPLYDETADGGSIRVNVVTQDRADLSSAASAGETLQAFDTLPVVTLKVDKSGLDELASQPGVVSVTEDLPVPPTLDQSVPLIGGDQAAQAGKTGAGSAIAILDTGVATKHPFLQNRVIAEACFSPADSDYAATSLCPNGTDEQEGAGTADSETGPCATIAECDHGTHVAGIVAGNGVGITGAPTAGVAPAADIIAIQVFSKFDSEDFCGTDSAPCVLSFTSAQIAALEKVLQIRQSGAPIIAANLSLGGGRYAAACDSDPRKVAIDNLLAAGVATVVAAGNSGFGDAVSAPACVSSAITVGSTTDDDELSSFTNRGALLDVFAPGTGIISSVPGDGYASKDGTSMAAPHVTGALAVLRQAFPDERITTLETRLKAAGKPITYTGAQTSRINVGKTIDETDPAPEPNPGPDPKPRPTTIINNTDHPIPDPGKVQSPITVNGIPGNAPDTLQVSVDATHEWLGEVKIDLLAPDGTTYPVKTTNGTDPGGTISTTYTIDASASPASGTWKLQTQDTSDGATGTLHGWLLTFPTPFEKTGTFNIPDPGTLISELKVAGISGNAAAALQVHVNATHEWRGDLKIELVAPDGRSYTVKPTSETENGGTISTTYTIDASASPASGTWKLHAQDTSDGATGTLHRWSLTFPSIENQTSYLIPDPGFAYSPITVSGIPGTAPKALRVYVDATHEWRGDLTISLTDPNGKVYLLKADSPSHNGGIIQHIYTVDASTSPANGTWELTVDDVSENATGTLNGWSLTF
ncbi:proprotein convertase P-domain-containing protein [Streptomyces rochei]|uniref:proprotein convertase P-domain-containing protein n=1 Tax=Streptomyces rochei TaxID=1928 RepID=UPI0036AE2465